MSFRHCLSRGARSLAFVPLFVLLVPILLGPTPARAQAVDLKTFVTDWYVHGTPYAEARAYGPQAIPELVAMLHDPAMEPHWVKVVYTLGCIGDPSAVQPLMDFLKGFHGEVSVDAFRGALGVLPALGSIANGGDGPSIRILEDFVQPTALATYGLDFSYGRYHGDALSEVLGRMSIMGLGFSGRPESLTLLNQMFDDHSLRADWVDNVSEAININSRIASLGPARVYAGEGR
jgi:hypothetical protein